ncbi:MAG: glycosyltransferase [Bacteroidota bacterium]
MKQKHHQPIRVLQIIDSLEAGGGERMAVNLTNALHQKVDFSGLIATRKEGLLKAEIDHLDHYLYVNKRRSVDFKALSLAMQFVKKHQITHLHAHSTSFFFATLIKIRKPKLKLIWHDHHGNRPNEKNQNNATIKIFSAFFNHVIICSQPLENWAKKKLLCKRVTLISNFVSNSSKPTKIHHSKEYIVSVANLRDPKDHFTLINAFEIISRQFDIDLLLVGDDRQDDYSKKIKQQIVKKNLNNRVYVLGLQSNVAAYIKNAKIAVLSSKIEGLPMALLEYAIAQKPVVVTDVGQCRMVVGDFAKLVQPGHPNALAAALNYYLSHPKDAKQDAERLHQKVIAEYGETAIINQIIKIYEKL